MLNKKRFKLALIGFTIASTLFACTKAETIQNCYTIENERTRQCEIIQPGETSTYNGEYNTISDIWNFNNNDLKVLWLKSAGGNNLNMGLFWNNGKLYNIRDYARISPATGIGETKYVCKVNSTDYQDIGQYCGLTACGNNDDRCKIYGLKNYTTDISTFMEDTNTKTPTEYIIMYSENASSRGPRICAKYDSFSYCIAVNPYYIKSYKSDIMTIIEQGVASQGETLTYYSNMFQNSPFTAGGGNNNQNFENLPMCYTIQQLINSYPKQYSIDMCYSANKIWNGTAFETITPQGMTTLRTGYKEYLEDVNLYRNYCNNSVATAEACQQAFTGKVEKWSIINKMTDQTTALRSYQYCHLQLDFTDEQKRTRTNCTVSTGTQTAPGITAEDIIEDITNKPIEITTPNGDTVFSGFVNITVGTGEDNSNYDGIIENMQSVRGKLISIFKYRSGIEGVIPDAIIWILLIIVLFAIFKK